MVPCEAFRSTNVREEEKLFRTTKHHLTPTVLLPLTITRPVTNREIPIAPDAHDTKLAVQMELTKSSLFSARSLNAADPRILTFRGWTGAE